MKKRIRGFIHIHSSISYDGCIPLENLASTFKAAGFSFAIITEHNDGLTTHHMDRINQKCAMLSSREFILVPGIEVRCNNNVHLLTIGHASMFYENIDITDAIREAKKRGVITILAHPAKYWRPDDEVFSLLDGVEIWNSKADSRWYPRKDLINLIKILRTKGRNIYGYAGLDLHRLGHSNAPWIELILEDELTAEKLFTELRKGQFFLKSSVITIPSHCNLNSSTILFLKFLEVTIPCMSASLNFLPHSLKKNLKSVFTI